MKIRLTFLGVGGATQQDLGHAAAVIEVGERRMLIDCGPGTIKAFRQRYNAMPDALFITHCHLDHVGDFENLFIQSWFHQPERVQPKVYVPATIIALLNERVGSYPAVLAEGGVNFWDAFHLIAVGKSFIFDGIDFNVLQVRHHAPQTAYGLQLPDVFFYTGDTRPIPEVLEHQLGGKETIFHDCGVLANPSHTGIEDIEREYAPALIERMIFYHYGSSKDAAIFARHNLTIARQGESFDFEFDVHTA